MKRASYRDAVDFIACNDDPSELGASRVADLTTTVLVANIFGVDAERVAQDIVRHRKRHASDK